VPWIRSWPELEQSAPSISDAKSARIFTLTSPDILIAWCLILQNK
jgi:hypothetical protein